MRLEPRTFVSLALPLVLMAAGCGAGPQRIASYSVSLPNAPTPEPPQVTFQAAQSQPPKLRIPKAGPNVLPQIRAIEGVAFATSVRVGESLIVGPQYQLKMKVAAVDPIEFRPLTPQQIIDEVDIWKRLVRGDAAFTHDAGERLRLELGAPIVAGGLARLRVGAFATNTVPPIADAIIDRNVALNVGLTGEDLTLVATTPKSSPATVAKRLRTSLGLNAEVIPQPQARKAAGKTTLEPFTYSERGDGMIDIDPEWVKRNIESARVPIFRGAVRCHKVMIPQLRHALQEIQDRGLGNLIDPSQYGGCYVPRHIDFNPAKSISMHAWGLALDLNVSTNGLGRTPTLDPRIVEIFEQWGFVWGGRWSRPDGMHFQLGAIVKGIEG